MGKGATVAEKTCEHKWANTIGAFGVAHCARPDCRERRAPGRDRQGRADEGRRRGGEVRPGPARGLRAALRALDAASPPAPAAAGSDAARRLP